MAKRSTGGDCYMAAVHVLFDAIGTPDIEELVLCHGTVTGTGGEVRGVRFGHAWVERPSGPNGTPWIIDRSNGRNVEMPVAVYYVIGKIDPSTVTRYVGMEAMKMLATERTYGPWGDEA